MVVERIWNAGKWTAETVRGAVVVLFSPNAPIPSSKLHPRMMAMPWTPGEWVDVWCGGKINGLPIYLDSNEHMALSLEVRAYRSLCCIFGHHYLCFGEFRVCRLVIDFHHKIRRSINQVKVHHGRNSRTFKQRRTRIIRRRRFSTHADRRLKINSTLR